MLKVKSAIAVLLVQSNQKKKKKEENKNILIDEKNCKDLTFYFATYIPKQLIKMLRLEYDELTGKIEEHERKNI